MTLPPKHVDPLGGFKLTTLKSRSQASTEQLASLRGAAARSSSAASTGSARSGSARTTASTRSASNGSKAPSIDIDAVRRRMARPPSIHPGRLADVGGITPRYAMDFFEKRRTNSSQPASRPRTPASSRVSAVESKTSAIAKVIHKVAARGPTPATDLVGQSDTAKAAVATKAPGVSCSRAASASNLTRGVVAVKGSSGPTVRTASPKCQVPLGAAAPQTTGRAPAVSAEKAQPYHSRPVRGVAAPLAGATSVLPPKRVPAVPKTAVKMDPATKASPAKLTAAGRAPVASPTKAGKEPPRLPPRASRPLMSRAPASLNIVAPTKAFLGKEVSPSPYSKFAAGLPAAVNLAS